MEVNDTVFVILVMGCIDTIVMILGDWCDTGVGQSEEKRKVVCA